MMLLLLLLLLLLLTIGFVASYNLFSETLHFSLTVYGAGLEGGRTYSLFLCKGPA